MSTSVTSYSVGLTLDASQYINNARLSRTETAKLKRDIESARSPVDKFARQYDFLEQQLQRGAISLETYGKLLQSARDKLEKATASTQKAATAQKQYNGEIITATIVQDRANASTNRLGGSIGLLAARYLSLYAAAATVKNAIRLDAELTQTAASFEVFTGSVETSEKMLSDMRALASATPLSFRAVADAGKTLMAFNVPAERVMATLNRLGDITGGNRERFKSLALAFAQSASAGRLMGQDLLQMVNAGFNPLQEISRKTGKSMLALKKEMEEGAISFSMVEEAFISATAEGGRFNGMMAKIGETSAGALAKAQSKAEMLLADLGGEIAPLTVQVLSEFEKWSPALEDASKNLGVMVDGLVAMSDAAAGLTDLLNFGDTKAGSILTNSTMTNLRLAKDYVTGMFSGDTEGLVKVREELGSMVFPKSINDSLDAFVDKQKNATEAAMSTAEAVNTEQSAVDALDSAFDDFEKKIAALEEHAFGSLLSDEEKLIAEGATKEQAKQIVQLQDLISLIEEEAKAQKEVEDNAKRIADAQRKAAGDALSNARKYFEEQRKLASSLQEDIIGKFKTIEVGTAEDVRYQAEAMNRLNAPVMTVETPTEDQLLAEAEKQFLEAKKQTEQNEKMLKKFDAMISELSENGFKRIR